MLTLIPASAAVLTESRDGLQIVDDLEVIAPRAGEVRVRISSCGLCHSDLSAMDWFPTPAVLGHEASGIVESVGSGVRHVDVGTRVVLTPMPACGSCSYCRGGRPTACVVNRSWRRGVLADGEAPFRHRGEPVRRGGNVGAFSQYTVVSAAAAIAIPDDLPLQAAALLGCSVQTGVGAVLNTAHVPPGATVFVAGLGAIGLSVIQGARIAGAESVIASDIIPDRLALAKLFGATETVLAGGDGFAREIRLMTDGDGVDYAFDAVGSVEVIRTCIDVTRPGGAAVIVGTPAAGQLIDSSLFASMLMHEKRLLTSLLGTSDSNADVPRLIDHWRAGELQLEQMITGQVPLHSINAALDDLKRGRGIRTVLWLE